MGSHLNRRDFVKASALGVAAGSVGAPWLAFRTRAANAQGGPGAELALGPTGKSVHDRGDAVITRYQANLDSGDFGVAPDLRTGLLYATQRVGNNVAIFDRQREQFVAKLPMPTEASGPHNVNLDLPTNSVWIAAGEGSKIARLVLDRTTLAARNFVEYTAPGEIPRTAKPHSLVIAGGREVWYTDDRQERVGVLDIATGQIDLLEEHIEADGIMLEERRVSAPRPRRRRPVRRRPRRPVRRRRRRPAFTGKATSPPAGSVRRRIWVAGGTTVTVIDAASRRILHTIEIEGELGISQLRLHDLGLEPRLNRVYVLMRGGDRITWLDRDRPQTGPKAYIEPAEPAAGLDHLSVGRTYIWWTEGRTNNLTRHDPRRGETVGYDVPVPIGYFNPHGVKVVPEWREVWFTERESLCKLTFKDGRQP